ncbi:MAG TPA: YdcF family protein [Candidatus Sulfotelmatobacter sp.]|nr:YdcF family protein [Candidatus Sulfotelmatobacter sp.]
MFSKNPGVGRIVFLALLAGLLSFAALAGKILVVNAPEASDLIVVLAGETDRRPALALELLHQGYAPRILLDVPAAARIYNTSALQVAEGYARSLPEAAQIGICPIPGLSTREESHDVLRCLAREKASRILIVTSDYHTRRARDIFRHEIPGRTFSVAGAQDSSRFGTRWWTHRQWAKTCLDEWLRLLWWSAIERWRN